MNSPLERLIGQSVEAIDTPALVVDLDAMDRNLAKMVNFAAAHNVKLRPHAKMHKSAVLAKLQMQAGAVGVCVQKASEAVALSQAGVDNIYISNEVIAPHKLQRVAQLASTLATRGGRLAIAVDSMLGLERLTQAAREAALGEHQLDVFVELDVGHGRCGVASADQVLQLAREITRHAPLRFAGLQAYHGSAQHLRSVAERHRTSESVLEKVRGVCALLDAAGLSAALVTGAGSGSFAMEAASGVYGELQTGSFMFMDADYARNAIDVSQPMFEHALFVKTQIMSVNMAHAVCDAGHKSHAIDSGLPSVHGAALTYANGGDEHGILRGLTSKDNLPALGEVLWLIPGHCDPTVNLHDAMVGVRGGLQHGLVEQIIPVDARGALT